ncbi:DUF3017 domain-containing protein [Actinomyces faecalis]|uniref:DUF3017 domain-containing protein n=1 Tax=Actinomyces faecalis TaxID=2722820 RepID=UPI0015542A3A|nr:DUF3017 domain-containing protein [Actinomyces faecalis]
MTRVNDGLGHEPVGRKMDLRRKRPGWAERHHEPYSTLAVVATAVATLLVPLLAVLGYNRIAVIWLGLEVLTLAVVRVMRPDGTWIAARSRRFDVVFGILLGLAVLALSWYATLPAIV